MKKLLYIVAFVFIISCSSDDSPSPEENFAVTIRSSMSTATIDEIIPITITSNKPLHSIGNLYYNGVNYNTGNYNGTISGTSGTIYVQFHTAGNHTVSVDARDGIGEVTSNTLNFSVSQGNVAQITNINITSLDAADGNADPDESGEDQKPDVFLTLWKYKISPLNQNHYIRYDAAWKETSVKENAQNMNWNVSGDSYFLKPEVPIWIQVWDKDGSSQSNMSNLNERYLITLSDYPGQPSVVTKTYSDMEIEFTVDWN